MEAKKQTVKLREKDLIDGNKSLYLDIIWNGIRQKKYLHLYIVKPQNTLDRAGNKETYSLAESIRAMKQTELQNSEYGQKSMFKRDVNFIAYFQSLTDQRKDSPGSWGDWNCTLNYLKTFCPPDADLKSINKDFVLRFRNYLQTEAKKKDGSLLSINTQSQYFIKFRASLNTAFENGLIANNPVKTVKVIKIEETHREHLTIEEVKSLAKKECKQQVVKNAFLFSCLTGLRISDLLKLKWSEVRPIGTGWKLDYRQQKTQSQEYLDISDQAHGFLGERGESDSLVFSKMKGRRWYHKALTAWCTNAGISRTITFHCARHTFATLQLNNGTDIFTVSKLLGHKDIKTTQIYAKIMDEKKREAMNRIPDINL